jgi:YVTN family beta-propeller protein
MLPPRRTGRLLALSVLALVPLVARPTAGAETAPPPQGLLIVLNKQDSTVSFIEARAAGKASDRLRLLKTSPTGREPHEVAVSPDRQQAWVSNAGDNSVSVFDLARLEALAVIRNEGFKFPHGGAFTPDGGRFYLACTEANTVFSLDAATREVKRAIPTGQTDSHMVAMAPDGGRIFVPNIGSRTITVISTASDQREREVRVGRGPEGIALTPDGRRLLVANQEDSTVSVIDTASLSVVDAFEVGEFPVRLLVTPDGSRAFSADRKGNTLTAIRLDGDSPTVMKRLPVGKSPGGLAIDGAGRTLFASLNDEARVVLIDVAGLKKVGEIRTGNGPDGIAFVPLWRAAPGSSKSPGTANGAGSTSSDAVTLRKRMRSEPSSDSFTVESVSGP